MTILSMMKVDTGLVILDDSGSDLMKKHSSQSNFNVTTFCDKTLQNTGFWDPVSGKRPETIKQLTILWMMKVDTGLEILDVSASDLRGKKTLQSNYNVTAAKTLQNTAFSGRINGRWPQMTEYVTILCMTKLHTQLVSLNDSGSDLMKNH